MDASISPAVLQHDQLSAPLGVVWDPDWRCNLNCAHCSTARNESNAPWPSVLNEVSAIRPFFVSLGGGEPLLFSDRTLTILEALALSGVMTNLTTNATLVDPKLAAKLAVFRSSMKVTVSIDDWGAGGVMLRDPDSRHAAMRGLELLQNAGIAVALAVVVTRQNVSVLPDSAIALARERAIGAIKFSRVKPAGRAAAQFAEFCCDAAALQAFFERCVKGSTPEVRLEIADPLAASTALQMAGCPAGRTMLYIAPSGHVTPCAFWGRTFGVTPRDDLQELWASMSAWVAAQRPPAGCDMCPVFAACGGGCPAAREACPGFGGRDPQCPRPVRDGAAS
ncbi:MAG: radical SAM protein [Bryobacteraceae bacterium]|nr:radical SAM protein [Bryobacteraceae bacterium]